jgi:hypothetical protein
MNIEDIKSLISETLQQSELALQVNQTGQQLSIVMNRPNNLEVDYEELVRKILEALLDKLSPEDLTSIEAIKFFGRIKGQPKQEWQKLQKLNGLPQKKVEPIPETIAEPPLSIAVPATITPRKPPLTTLSQYEPSKTTDKSSSSALGLINKFKFSELFTTFKDIISTGSLVGIFLILLLNFFAGQKPRSVEWEYTIEAVPDSTFTETMNIYGKSGWELVTARRAVDSITDRASYECIFKRVRR